MKNILTLILIGCLCLTLPGCRNNPNTEKTKYINKDVIEKISSTTKVIIKNKEENISLGTITDTNTINEIIDIIENSTQEGDVFLCDGTNLIFEMYDNNDKLIDTISIWTHSERIMPISIKNSGCEYYVVPKNKTNLKSIIEKNTNLKFYVIYDETENCDTMLELIYEDNHYRYYFDCVKSDKVFIEFLTTNKKITLKEALNNNYIEADEIYIAYPDLLIRKEK